MTWDCRRAAQDCDGFVRVPSFNGFEASFGDGLQCADANEWLVFDDKNDLPVFGRQVVVRAKAGVTGGFLLRERRRPSFPFVLCSACASWRGGRS